jgi:hypothetical protein
MIRRRDFVAGAGGALAVGCVPVSILAATRTADPALIDLSTGLSKDKFAALLNQNFYVATPRDGVMVLELVELRDGTAAQGDVRTDSFTLFFQGVPSPTLPDAIYTLEHGSAGSTLLRLEGANVVKRRARYRADFCLFA